MKKTLLLVFTAFINLQTFSQAPPILWQKTYGGAGGDVGLNIIPTSDGGYIFGGNTNSNNGNVSGNHGNKDFWIVKTDASGTIQWQKTFGGTLEDHLNAIQLTTDGGYIAVGYSFSNNGDITGHHGTTANCDAWAVKINSTGTIVWQKSLGGSSAETFVCVQENTDGTFIMAGAAKSTDGDVTGYQGGTTLGVGDAWIVKLSSTGTLLWQKTIGGTLDEAITSIKPNTDGTYIMTGFTRSNNGDVSGNHGNSDYLVVKLSATGTIVWQKALGGTQNDLGYNIITTPDGGYIIVGQSNFSKWRHHRQ